MKMKKQTIENMVSNPNIHSDHEMASFPSDYKHNIVLYRNIHSNYGIVSFTSDYIQHLKESYSERSYIGKPEYMYRYCNAIFWFSKRNREDSRKNKQIMYSKCCKYGQIKIPPYKQPPPFPAMLINNKDNALSKQFLPKIRQHNSLFAFTSMGGGWILTIILQRARAICFLNKWTNTPPNWFLIT
jgi:hypothetical protein